jgi:hypothetical protein
MGNVHAERGLAYYEVVLSGHMIPQFSPWVRRRAARARAARRGADACGAERVPGDAVPHRPARHALSAARVVAMEYAGGGEGVIIDCCAQHSIHIGRLPWCDQLAIDIQSSLMIAAPSTATNPSFLCATMASRMIRLYSATSLIAGSGGR